jgi:hypothetical protein
MAPAALLVRYWKEGKMAAAPLSFFPIGDFNSAKSILLGFPIAQIKLSLRRMGFPIAQTHFSGVFALLVRY